MTGIDCFLVVLLLQIARRQIAVQLPKPLQFPQLALLLDCLHASKDFTCCTASGLINHVCSIHSLRGMPPNGCVADTM